MAMFQLIQDQTFPAFDFDDNVPVPQPDRYMTQADPLTDWLNAAGRFPLLPRAETLRIANEIKKCKEGSAKRRRLINKLVSHNLRLVASFVNSYMRTKTKREWGCLETVDYLQCGAMGLYRAAEKFDPDRGYEFSTYAAYWIRSFVGRYNMKNSSCFTVSEEACRKAYQFEKHGEVSKVAQSSPWIKDPSSAAKLVRAAQSPVSLYAENDSGSCLIDLLASDEESGTQDLELMLDGLIKKANLSEIESSLMKALYLDGLERVDVCCEFDLTLSQFKRIKDSAIGKVRRVATPDIMYM